MRHAQVPGVRRPPSVPRQREDEWKGTFVPPLRTFFTVPENYDFQKSGGATIAAGGLDVYTGSAIPGWAMSILQTGMTMGRVYRVKMSADGRSAVGPNEELFRTANRYRDIAIGRDQRTFYFVPDEQRASAARRIPLGCDRAHVRKPGIHSGVQVQLTIDRLI